MRGVRARGGSAVAKIPVVAANRAVNVGGVAGELKRDSRSTLTGTRDAYCGRHVLMEGLDFCDTTLSGQTVSDEHSDPARAKCGKGNVAPDIVIAVDGAARHVYKSAAIPVLHVEVGDTELRDGLGKRRLGRVTVIILKRVNVDPINRLGGSEVDLDPIGESAGSCVLPATTSKAPTGAAGGTIDNILCRIVWVLRRSRDRSIRGDVHPGTDARGREVHV